MLSNQEINHLHTKLLVIEDTNQTIGKAFIDYMDNLNLSFKTIEIYINYFLLLDIYKMLTGDTQQYITDFINQKKKKNNKRMSNHHHPVVRFFLKRLLDFVIVNHTMLGLTADELKNIKSIQVPKATGRKRKEDKSVLSKEDVDKLIQQAEKLSYKVMIKLSFFCGLRMKELLSLTSDDINIPDKIIRIRPEISKGNKGRIVPITEVDNTYQELKIYLVKRRIWNEKNNIKNDKRIFKKKRWQWQYQLEKYSLKGLGYKIQPHALRHACGTFLSRNGADIQEIQKYLGHSNMQTTMLYLHKNTKEINDKVLNIFQNYNQMKEHIN